MVDSRGGSSLHEGKLDPVERMHLMIYREAIGSAIAVCQVLWSAVCFSWLAFLWPSHSIPNHRVYKHRTSAFFFIADRIIWCCLDLPHRFTSFLQFCLPHTFLRNKLIWKKKKRNKLICLSENVLRNKGEVTLQDQTGISRKFQ